MRIGSNGSIPEFIAEVAEAIEEAVSENQYATGCEIPEEPYVDQEPTYNPGSYNDRCGYDNSSWMQSNLFKTLGRALENGRNEKLAGLATQGNATDYLMAATGHGGTTYTGVGPFTGSFMGMGGQITPEKLEQDFNAGKTVVVATPKDPGGMFAGAFSQSLKDQYGLEAGHCYTVKRVYTDERGQKMAELSDPTGQSQPRPINLNDMPGYQVAVG